MGFGLFRDDFPFYRLFRKQWSILNRAIILLDAIMGDLKELPARCGEIHELEIDQIKASREVFKELSLTFIQPLGHQDVYALNRAFDEAMRGVKAVSTRVGLYGFSTPMATAGLITTNLMEMAEEIGAMLEHLRSAGPDSLPMDKVETMREEARMLFLLGMGEIYEGDVTSVADILEVVKWSQIYDRLEEAFNLTTEVARAVSAIILKAL